MKTEFIGKEQEIFMREGKYIFAEETPQQRYQEIVDRIREYEDQYGKGLADRLEYMIDENILSLSTPIIANFGRKYKEEKNTYPLPVSCNIVSVGNSISDIYESIGQVAMLSKLGAGVGADWQLVCDKNTKLAEGFYSNSKLDWIEDAVRASQKVSQGAVRRGYSTPFISINDPDFPDLMYRIDKNNPNKEDPLINNTIGVILPRGFWDKINGGDQELQKRWVMALNMRKKTGKLYLADVENMNKNSSPVYKKLGMDVQTTNICTEFLQPLFDDKTSACVISALNLTHWDTIKENPQMIKDAIYFLDIINEEYIKLTEDIPFLQKARKAAIEKRDIGLGTLGFHEFLQMNDAAFGDLTSRRLNKEVYSTIREYAEIATSELGKLLGSPKLCQDAGLVRRNCSLLMIAPNKSTSFLAKVTSLGIEPFLSNLFVKKLANIQHVFKNKHLEKILDDLGENTPEVWNSIENNNGSVLHLDFLTEHQKEVFMTFAEISPKDIIDLASDRQKYIDMGQSLNLVFRKNYTLKDIVEIHKYAFENEIKTLYYAYPSAHAALEKDGEAWDTCVSCAD